MPRIATALTVRQVKNLVHTPGKHAVGGVPGLTLLVTARKNGIGCTASWILRLQTKSTNTQMGLGPYPSVSLEEARRRGRDAWAKLKQGKDPVHEEREVAVLVPKESAARKTVFSDVFQDWLAWAKTNHGWKYPEYRATTTSQEYSLYLEDTIGKDAVADLDVSDVASLLLS
ncbi:MAG: Arm DNA-binding domain-containing protein [Burkholderiales bacterium]|nr:Arm DNA-binding domain-containing protein [Burkholderiales bacterium]